MTSQNPENRESNPQREPQIQPAHSVNVLALMVLAQSPKWPMIPSPMMWGIVSVLVVLVVIFVIMRTRAKPKKPDISQRREPTPEDRVPTKDVLDDRMEVDEPVEITDDMSLAEVKRIKAARVTRKEKAVRRETSKDATERAHREREQAEQAAKDAADKIKSSATEEAEKVADAAKQAEPDVEAQQEQEDTSDDKPIAPALEKPSETDASDEEILETDPSEVDPSEADPSEAERSIDESSEEKGSEDEAPTEEPARKISLKKPDFSKLAPKKPADSDKEGDAPKKPKLDLKIPKPKITLDKKADEKPEKEEAVDQAPKADVEPEPQADPAAEEQPKQESAPEAAEPETEPEAAEAPKPVATPQPEPSEQQKTLAQGLAKTRGGFIGRLSGLFSGDKLAEDMVDEVEEILFTADIGPRVAQAIMSAVQDGLSGDEMDDPARIWGFIREYCADLLKSHEQPLQIDASKPFVMLVVGVNGAGKTTTIGKLASKLSAQGKKVLLVAGDTYRAGAVDQLAVWADRTHIPIHQGDDEADPSSVLFAGIERGIDEDFDVVICDTSGRLQTNVNLMDELAKMARVAGKALDGAPHETMLVLDANTGQNAIVQAQKFNEAVEITGISLTKLDGTARGGVILGICDQLDAPMRYIGIGESVEDLRAFDADDFVDALFM